MDQFNFFVLTLRLIMFALKIRPSFIRFVVKCNYSEDLEMMPHFFFKTSQRLKKTLIRFLIEASFHRPTINSSKEDSSFKKRFWCLLC